MLIAPDRFVRLGDDSYNLVFGFEQRAQRRHADFARADKDNAHAASYGIS